nr:ATP-grasp domain-containing protein [uncultured Schaedlerella sp.]
MKKILLLGGSAQQVVAIETAKRLGHYTVLCDYLADNPGQYMADQFYLVSTTNKKAILQIAREEKVEGILAYASDPAAPTAAYVAEQLNLPGNPYSAVEILCNKDYFRAFLKENGFHTPVACGYFNIDDALLDLQSGYFRFPVIVKPVDSSGSKGINRIDTIDEARDKLKYAMSFSHKNRIILEEYVEKLGYQIAGDGCSIDGKLVFSCFANDHFNPKCNNPFVPVSASFPYNMPQEIHKKIHVEIQRLLTILNMKTTPYNFDIRIDKNYNVYLMEVAPRDGGNYIPQVIRYMTGIDLVECSVKAALGEPFNISPMYSKSGYWSYFAVHSLKEGILEDVEIDPIIANCNIVEKHFIKKAGDRVRPFRGANDTLGCLIMRFDNMTEMLDMMDHSEKWCHVRLRQEE